LLEIKKTTYFHFFALKTDNSLFCHRDIPSIHNGYCDSNAVDYAKKNDVLPTICQSSPQKVHLSFSKTRDDIDMKSAKYCEVTSKVPIFINKT